MITTCKICNESFSSIRSLHAHIKKHDVYLYEYYNRYWPRKDKYSGATIPFKNFDEYFKTDFINKSNMYKWLNSCNKTEAKQWIIQKIKERIQDKKLKYIPSHVELCTIDLLPDLLFLENFFENGELEKNLGVLKIFNKEISDKQVNIKNLNFIIDTREQKPINLPNSRFQKLIFGDYTLDTKDYNYTYIDRKSEVDFKNTVTKDYDRFCKEIEAAIDYDCYLYILIESSVKKIVKNNEFAPHKANMKYVFSKMREIQHKYPKKIQFVFSGSRENSQKIIPYLLGYGKNLWNTDIQLILDKKNVGNRQSTN